MARYRVAAGRTNRAECRPALMQPGETRLGGLQSISRLRMIDIITFGMECCSLAGVPLISMPQIHRCSVLCTVVLIIYSYPRGWLFQWIAVSGNSNTLRITPQTVDSTASKIPPKSNPLPSPNRVSCIVRAYSVYSSRSSFCSRLRIPS